jgi:predicted ArsR family transcriptional regulator
MTRPLGRTTLAILAALDADRGFTHDDIGRAVGISTNAAKTYLYRLRDRGHAQREIVAGRALWRREDG